LEPPHVGSDEQSTGISGDTHGSQGFFSLLKEKSCSMIQILSYNSAAVYNINRRAASKNLAPSLRYLLLFAQEQGFKLTAAHIPKEDNIQADSLSRLETSGDYSIKPEIYSKVTEGYTIGRT
jgi:hypothetical protein